ncbi:MAG: sialate O-acetylesterase [Clostridia bacterium]|nr:sialate O-acetylesterase [Clostridia bacterium]
MNDLIKDGLREQEEPIYSFLLIGQSNMAGRGEFTDVEPIKNKNCRMLRMGRWQTMSEPINPDRAILSGLYHSGVCLAASFADAVAKANACKVGLIPCADGGTRLNQWMPGEILYDHAVMMTKLALRTSKLAGILWHQGESDCNNQELVDSYKDRFLTMITSLRRDLGAEAVPVIIGELSELIDPEHYGRGVRIPQMNENFHAIAKELPLCSVVSSKGLTLKADGIHFDSVSLREFGLRYAKAYEGLSTIFQKGE